VIRYRDADYAAHTTRWVEQADEADTVEPWVPLRVRVALAQYLTFALGHLRCTGGHVLDVGCRLAWLDDYLRHTPWIYEGGEPNVHAVRRARALGRNVHAAPQRDRYDLVFARQMLQYVDDVPALLARLACLVAPGGLLCIVQSLPYSLDELHHFNSVDAVGDLLPHIPLEIELAGPIASISPSEHVLLARRPA
jgi:SAM-dependent methyltransferase